MYEINRGCLCFVAVRLQLLYVKIDTSHPPFTGQLTASVKLKLACFLLEYLKSLEV